MSNRLLTGFPLLLLLLLPQTINADSDVQIGRYSTTAAAPTKEQVHLLQVVVSIEFPNSINTVGEGINYALKESGYALAPQRALSDELRSVLQLRLPKAHRRLGPMPLQWLLVTLVGPSWQLVEDPIHRLVSFDRCDLPLEPKP